MMNKKVKIQKLINYMKSFLKRCVFSFDLKILSRLALFTTNGGLFNSCAADTLSRRMIDHRVSWTYCREREYNSK